MASLDTAFIPLSFQIAKDTDQFKVNGKQYWNSINKESYLKSNDYSISDKSPTVSTSPIVSIKSLIAEIKSLELTQKTSNELIINLNKNQKILTDKINSLEKNQQLMREIISKIIDKINNPVVSSGGTWNPMSFLTTASVEDTTITELNNMKIELQKLKDNQPYNLINIQNISIEHTIPEEIIDVVDEPVEEAYVLNVLDSDLLLHLTVLQEKFKKICPIMNIKFNNKLRMSELLLFASRFTKKCELSILKDVAMVLMFRAKKGNSCEITIDMKTSIFKITDEKLGEYCKKLNLLYTERSTEDTENLNKEKTVVKKLPDFDGIISDAMYNRQVRLARDEQLFTEERAADRLENPGAVDRNQQYEIKRKQTIAKSLKSIRDREIYDDKREFERRRQNEEYKRRHASENVDTDKQ